MNKQIMLQKRQIALDLMNWHPMTEPEKVRIGLYRVQQMGLERMKHQIITAEPVHDFHHHYGFAQPTARDESIMTKYGFKGTVPASDRIRHQEREYQFVSGDLRTREARFNFAGAKKTSLEEFFI